jgi:hypothetical protein
VRDFTQELVLHSSWPDLGASRVEVGHPENQLIRGYKGRWILMHGRLASGMGRVGVGSRPRIFGFRYQTVRTDDQETQQSKENENRKEKQSKLGTQLGKLVLIGKDDYSQNEDKIVLGFIIAITVATPRFIYHRSHQVSKSS